MRLKIDTTINDNREVLVTLEGRLDANTAKELHEVLSKSVDYGYMNIMLNCRNLLEISSAGLDLLIHSYNEFCEFNGSISLTSASYELEKFLSEENATFLLQNKRYTQNHSISKPHKFIKANDTIVKYYKLPYQNQELLEAFGNPDKFAFKEFAKEEPFLLRYSKNDIGLGLGAMSYDVTSSKDTFGEFINVGEYTFHMPSCLNAVPDYQKINGLKEQFFKIHTLYGLRSSNAFNNCIKFSTENNNPLNLSNLIYSFMELSQSSAVSFVVCARLASLSAIKLVSPIFTGQYNDIFNKSNFDKNFKLMSQYEYKNDTVVMVGFAINQANTIIKKFLKPYNSSSTLYVHAHALIFDKYFNNFSENNSVNDIISFFTQNSKALDLCHVINNNVNNTETSFTEGICFFNKLKEFRTGEF